MRDDALLKEIGDRLSAALRSRVSPRRRRPKVVVVAVCSGLAVLATGLVAGEYLISSHGSAAPSPATRLGFGNDVDVGAKWSPDYPQGQEVTLQQAQTRAGYPLYLPDVQLASDAALAHVWVGTESVPGPPMLPETPPTTVAASYSSGVVVSFVPWVYGVDAPPFSEQQVLSHYQQMVSQDASDPSSSIGMSTDIISGVPVLVIPQDIENSANPTGEHNPGSIEFQLGTANSNAITVRVQSRLSTSDLESVASSIISQWEQANPSAVLVTGGGSTG